jgi:hypothetical protein
MVDGHAVSFIRAMSATAHTPMVDQAAHHLNAAAGCSVFYDSVGGFKPVVR